MDPAPHRRPCAPHPFLSIANVQRAVLRRDSHV
ncbi:hypothetical protein M2282_002004 [Variovorax boronicumulans]|nr:hypothetical protein [Variovorax boronicumulans]